MQNSTHITCAFLIGLLAIAGVFDARTAHAQSYDYGDAPDVFGTLAPLGARLIIIMGGPRLGLLVDADAIGFPSFGAVGDDLDNTDDEDGVKFLTPLILDTVPTIATIQVTASQVAKLDAWIDFNGNFVFDVGDQIFDDYVLAAGENLLTFTVPTAGVTLGEKILRFRISSAGVASPIGTAPDGEVEDYREDISAPGSVVTLKSPDGLSYPMTIDQTGVDVRVRASDGTIIFQRPISSMPALIIEGTDDDDHFLFDLSGGLPMPLGGILVKGEDEGAGGDVMTLTGTTVTNSVHTFLTEQTGQVALDMEPLISYSGLEPIFDLLTATNKIFNYSASSEEITLEDDGDVADGQSFVDSDIGSESVTFSHPTAVIEINAGDGTNVIRIKQIDSMYAGDILITGGGADDFLHADWSDGNPLLTGVVFNSGNHGAVGDSVIVELGTVPSVDITYTAAFGATMTIDGGTLDYTTVLPVRDELTSATKVINLRSTDFGGTFGDDIYVGNNRSKHTVSIGGDTYTFIDPTASVTLNGGAGNNRLVLSKMDDATNLPVILNGGAGDDTFYIDFVNGNPLTTVGITFNGDGQVISDRMELLNGSADLSTYVYANANDGTITIDGGRATYTGLEPILDLLDITDRTFTFSSVANDVTLHDDLAAGNGYSIIESAAPTSEITTFLNPSGILTINLGDGDDDIHIKNLDSASGPESVIVNGDDDFLVAPDLNYEIHTNGGDPGVLPGDTFTFDLSLLSNTLLTYFELTSSSGYFSLSGGYKKVSFENMEDVPYQFYLLEPIHTLSGVSQLPTYTWDYGASTFANIGSIYLETDPDTTFTSSLRLLKDGLPSTAKTTEFDWDEDGLKLIAKTIYYWRAVANLSGGALGTGNGLTAYRYRLESIGDLTAVLNYPHDGLETEDESFEFTFHAPDEVHSATFLVEVDGPIFDPTDGLDIGSIIISDESFDISDLPDVLHAGGTYSWRVKTFIGTAVAGISEVATFSILGGVIVPTPSYPIDGLQVYTNDVQFAWYPSAPFDDLLFDLEFINTTAGEIFTGTPDESDIEGLSELVEGLLPGKNYSWRVRTTHVPSAMISAWSASATFSTTGAGTTIVPVLNWPIGGAEVHTTAPTLSWSLNGNASGLTYEVSWRPQSIFAFTEVVVTEQTYLLSDLGGGTTYEWKVRSVNSNGDKSDYSDVETFKVSTVLPASKAVALPMNDEFVISTLMPEFKWHAEGDGGQILDFDLEWSVDGSFSKVSGGVKGIKDLHYLLSPGEMLDAGQTYTWRVAANRRDGSVSDWSDPASMGSFSTATSNGNLIPTPVGPHDVTIVLGDRQFLNWQVHGRVDLVDEFELQVSRDSDFRRARSFVTDNFAQVVGDLERGALYHWRVRSRFGPHYSPYSAPRSFIVHNNGGPIQPVPAGPSDGTSLDTRQPVLSWFTYGEQATPITFRVELSLSPTFDDVIVMENIASNAQQTPRLEVGTYYWRVQGVSEGSNRSPLSEISTFATGGIVVSSEDPYTDVDSELPQRVELLQNYPNPFNPETIIGYSLPESSHVSISVYDLQGRLVRLLVDGLMPAGQHHITWNARDELGRSVASGVYLYELRTPTERQVKQLVLIK